MRTVVFPSYLSNTCTTLQRNILQRRKECDYPPICLLSNNNKMAFTVLWIRWVMLRQRVDHCSEWLILYLLLSQYIHFPVFYLILCPLLGPGQVVSPSGECLYVILPQWRGNTPHPPTWWSGPPWCCPAGLVPPGHPVSLIQSVSAAWPVSEVNLVSTKKTKTFPWVILWDLKMWNFDQLLVRLVVIIIPKLHVIFSN